MANIRPKLSERTFNFSRDVLSFCKSEPLDLASKRILDQLIRSATSIGANYTEANNASSPVDFRNKIFIAKKEAAETKYWLALMADVASDRQTCERLAEECQYILMTLQKIVSTMYAQERGTVKG